MANSNWVILSPSDGELIAGLEKIVSSLSIEQASYTISISEGYNQNLNGLSVL